MASLFSSWKTEQPGSDWAVFSLPDVSLIGSASGGDSIDGGHASSDSEEEELVAGRPMTLPLEAWW